jgi:hypothetical protein
MRTRLPEALGFGTGLFLSEIYPVLNVNGLSAYHSSGVSASPLLASLLGIAAGATVFFGVIAIPKSDRWQITRLALMGLLGLPLLLANRLAIAYVCRRFWERISHAPRRAYFYPWAPWKVTAAFLVGLMAFVIIVKLWPRAFKEFAAIGRIGLLTLGLLGCVGIINVGRALVAHRHDYDFVATHQRTPQQQAEHPRVVWILFDELSEDQLYDHRASGLSLPNFDSLAGQSDVYSQVEPEGFSTETVLPSLMMGEHVDSVRYTFRTGARFHYSGQNIVGPFAPQKTLFAEAQAQGWNVGIAGWWNPYCMLLAGELQSCKWIWREDWADRQMTSQRSILTNLQRWFDGLYQSRPGAVVLRTRLDENHHLERWAQQLITDPGMDFIFIHMTPPHGPYPYDKNAGAESVYPGGSYLDGLAEADYELGALMKYLKASPRWGQTTIVVNGDHTWRSPTYKSENIWTAEDERISNHALIDPRPALLIHNPGQSAKRMIEQPTPLMHAHDVMQAIIQGGKDQSPMPAR